MNIQGLGFFLRVMLCSKSPVCSALMYMAIIALIYLVITGVSYLFLGYADVEMDSYKTVLIDGNTLPENNPCPTSMSATDGTCQDPGTVIVSFRISVIVYGISVICLISYVFFSVFGGIGLVSTPLGFIQSYLYRPRPIGGEEYRRRKLYVADRVAQLIEEGMQYKKDPPKRKRKHEWKKVIDFLYSYK